MIKAFQSIKVWRYRRKVKTAISILKDLNNIMKLAGYKRYERRRIWRGLLKNAKIANELVSIYKMGPS